MDVASIFVGSTGDKKYMTKGHNGDVINKI